MHLKTNQITQKFDSECYDLGINLVLPKKNLFNINNENTPKWKIWPRCTNVKLHFFAYLI